MAEKIGLVLSGGGARGLAHIGVLKVLERENIPVHVLAGTSMGGLVASAYACGFSAEDLEQHALYVCQSRQLIKLMDVSAARRGLLEGNRVKAHLAEWLGENRSFEDLVYPLSLNAVDLNTGKEVVFTSGPLLPALFATIAFPGVFAPIQFNNRILVDGGVLDNLPLANARSLGADKIIAVDVQVDPTRGNRPQSFPLPLQLPRPLLPPEFILDFYWSLLIMLQDRTQRQVQAVQPEVLIQPELPVDFDMFLSFPKVKQIIEYGEQAAMDALPRIRELITRSSSGNPMPKQQ
jgi:NTE family protein